MLFIFSSWTINEYSPDGEVEWDGLFYRCTRLKCTSYYNNHFLVIFAIIIGAAFLLVSTVCIFLMGVHSFPRRHFYITPLITFIAILLIFFALNSYACRSVINGISARLVITSLVLVLTSFAIISYVAGRYAVFYRRNPIDFEYTKTEETETVRRMEEQQTMETGAN